MENKQFQTNTKQFYRNLNKQNIELKDIPESDITSSFWKNIWEENIKFNSKAKWINEFAEFSSLNQQQWVTITDIDFQQALSKLQNWKAPGIDKIQNFWLKNLTALHPRLTQCFNEIIEDAHKTPQWLTEGITILLPKSNDTSDPKNYRPITCLSTSYKLLTSIISNCLYAHLKNSPAFPIEQKGCRRGSYGCKDQLLINKTILETCKKNKRNLSTAWVDYKKAFDSVSHDWIIQILQILNTVYLQK